MYHSRLRIGDDVWVAANAIVLESLRKIGNGVVIAAGSVVTKGMSVKAIVTGNRARDSRNRNQLKPF